MFHGHTLPIFRSSSYHNLAEIKLRRELLSRWRVIDGLSILISLHAACVCDNGQTLYIFVMMLRPIFSGKQRQGEMRLSDPWVLDS